MAQPHRFRFSGDLANSLTDRARSFASLTKSGMPLGRSRRRFRGYSWRKKMIVNLAQVREPYCFRISWRG